ncbi:hypothetical protein [Roseateles sp. P5_E7]
MHLHHRFCIALVACIAVQASAVAGQEDASLQIRAIASAEQKYYVSNLKEAFTRWCKEKANVCVNELLIRPAGMTVPRPYDQVRLDLVSNLDGKFESSRYEHDKPFKQFSPRTFQFSKAFKVTVHPFVWNRVELRSKERPATIEPLTTWAERWIDLSDTKTVPKGQLLGVVHSVIYPSIKDDYWQTLVDFGSSEPYMLDSLLRTLEAMGFTEVEVGSFSTVQK